MKCKKGYKKIGEECVKTAMAVKDNYYVHSYGGGVGFFSLLGLLFIGLKLGNVIEWSWWYVLMPLYLPFVLALITFLIVFLFMGVFRR